MGNPLDGLTVVAFEQAVAAPLCTRHLADLGARVVKVENPHGGDFTRSYDDAVNGLASYFVWLNRNKESIALDVKAAGAQSVLDRLIEEADVVVQNLAPGAAARLGVDAATVHARNPRAIGVDMSGYGTGGPLAHKRAYDLLVQAEAGSCAVTGWPGQPAKPGVPVADVGAGMYALSSVLAALVQRGVTGLGTAISVSMFDTVAEWMGFSLMYTSYTGVQRQPNGLSSPMVSPYGAYPSADGQTVVLGTTNDAEWQRLATQLLQRPELAADPRYASNAQRCTLRPELDAAITEWTATLPLAEIQRRADDAGIGNARYNTVADVVTHEHLQARERWVDVDSPGGPVRSLKPPFEADGWRPRMDAIPGLGQHSEAVLASVGFTDAEISALLELGVVQR